jgi:hypothetical protein
MPQILSVGARSPFVNSVAWIGILLALLFAMSPLARSISAPLLSAFPAQEGLMRLYEQHLPWLVASGVALSLATLAAAIGLLLRLNWARVAFIGLLTVGIVANLAGLWLQQEMVQTVVSRTLASSELPVQALDALGGLAAASRVLGAFMTVGTCGLLAWIIYRLMSRSVRQEFC